MLIVQRSNNNPRQSYVR